MPRPAFPTNTLIGLILEPLRFVLANLASLGANALRLVLAGPRPYRVLRLELEGHLDEERGRGGLLRLLRPTRTTLLDAVDLLDTAARDPALDAVLVKIGPLRGGWASVQTLAEALTALRARGKRVVAFLESAENLDYLLATAADRIVLHPVGGLHLVGLRAEVTLFGETLDRIGIQADLERIGKYKSAPEAYTGTRMSGPAREALTSLIDDLYEQLRDAIAERRGLDPGAVDRLIDRGPFLGEDARAAGLIDELAFEDEVLEELAGEESTRSKLVGPRRYRLLRRRSYRPLGGHRTTRVAWIPIVGTIRSGRSGPGADPSTGSASVVRQLRRARLSPHVDGVLLRIDSPGGSGLASDVLWREVERTRNEKPVVVSMGDYAASGGYYVAAPATAIVASPGTLTGSIGVFGGKISLGRVYERVGLHKETHQRGRHAGLLSDLQPFSPAERRKIRADLQAFYERFLDCVADGRGREREEIAQHAAGRVWTGRQALDRGLVDELGGILKALSVLRARIGHGRDRKLTLVTFAAAPGWQRFLAEARLDPGSLDLGLGRLPAIASWLDLLRHFPRTGVLALLGLDIRIR